MRAVIITLLLLLPGYAQADPLFEYEPGSDELLKLSLTGPIVRMVEARDDDLLYPNATVTVGEGDHQARLPVRIQVRGKTRLDPMTCSFPPLRLHFTDQAVAGTLFEHQEKLKLVTQCRPENPAYEDYLISEYLAYRIFNLLTPNSYQVRLAMIRYIDDEAGLLHERYGFFLESNRRLADRTGRTRYKAYETHVSHLNRTHLNKVSLFQYLIGHMDWSATHTSREECCHNGRLFGGADDQKLLYIPYDFDFSGLVNASYARVAATFGLKDVRQRRYGGYCSNNNLLPETLRLFNDKHDAIRALISETPYLDADARVDKLEYIESFFETINDRSTVKSELHSFCYRSDDV